MNAIAITGKTFPIRRLIREIGGIWSYEQNAWIVPDGNLQKVQDLTNKYEILSSQVEVPKNFFAPLEGEALREYRQGKANRKAAWLRDRAARKGEIAADLFDREHKIMDMIPLGQPILTGHHSQRRHERDLNRINALCSKACEAFEESKRLASRADRLESGVRIKGDAEDLHEKHRQMIRETVKPGHIVIAGVYGEMKVIKMNRKTLQVKGSFGSQITVDMALVRLQE